MADCIFKVKNSSIDCKSSEKLSSSGPDRILKIINASKERGDELHIELQQKLSEDDNLTVTCHRSCVSSYTSTSHIKRYLKRQGQAQEQPSIEEPPQKRARRSQLPLFHFREHCIFCGDTCEIEKNAKNPNRWRKALLCKTSDRGAGSKSFKEVILDVCHTREDDWAMQVEVWLHGAFSDLHAADARYHDDCRIMFMAPRAI